MVEAGDAGPGLSTQPHPSNSTEATKPPAAESDPQKQTVRHVCLKIGERRLDVGVKREKLKDNQAN